MRKWQKILLWSGAGLAIVLLAMMLLARSMLDETQLKARVHTEIEHAMGRDLQLSHLQLKLFPLPQLQASDVVISNPQWAHEKDFVTAKIVTADIALLPLLRGKIEIKNIALQGAQINLETNTDGRRNWESLHGASDAEKPQSTLSLQSLQKTGLRSLLIEDSAISIRQPGDKKHTWQIKDLALSTNQGLRDIYLMTHLVHAQHEVELEVKLDDLSHLNAAAASTQGSLKLKLGQALATVDGTFPLDQAMTNFNLDIKLDVPSLKDIYAFLDRPYQSDAVLKGEIQLDARKQAMQLKDFTLQLGDMHASGHGSVDRTAAKPRFNVQLQADKVDMVQTFIDAGRPPLPPKPDGELLHDHPLSWPLLVALQGTQGKLDLQIASLKLRSGVMVSDARAQASFDGDRMKVTAFSGNLLQGKAHGDALFEGKDKSVQLNLHMEDAMLEEWLKQRGTHLKVKGGKIQIDARITTHGNSMKDFAAAMNGPVDIRIGNAVIQSDKAGNAEYWLTGLFSAKDASQVNMACAAGHLIFHSGVAKGDGIVGARSDDSQLLTSGAINMRTQTLDLHGRVRARSGVSLGLSNIADEVKIVGKLTKPALELDESGVLGVVARVGAAIFTSGISIIATSIWDGANPESDPCQIVFAAKPHKTKKDKTETDSQ